MTPLPAQELNKKLPKRVSRAVMSALEKNRTARPQTAAAFALTEEEFQAALCYYQRHEAEIKQRIEGNDLLIE